MIKNRRTLFQLQFLELPTHNSVLVNVNLIPDMLLTNLIYAGANQPSWSRAWKVQKMIRDDLQLYPGTLNNQFVYGCFNWMIQNLYIGNGWKSPNIHL